MENFPRHVAFTTNRCVLLIPLFPIKFNSEQSVFVNTNTHTHTNTRKLF